MTKPIDDHARSTELLASAADDEAAGRWDSAALKLQLAQAHEKSPDVAERLARALRRGAPGPVSSSPSVAARITPSSRPVPQPSPSGLRQSPMPMLLFSVLKNQHLLLGAGFATRYPHPWLVWELGPRRPADNTAVRNTLETQRPSQAGAAKVPVTDPLCFAVFGSDLRIGRSDECAIVIDDVTFSRDFGTLRRSGEVWTFEARAGGSTQLFAGAQLHHGDVTLTFETATSFPERLTRSGTA
jgi:hypothetical protein